VTGHFGNRLKSFTINRNRRSRLTETAGHSEMAGHDRPKYAPDRSGALAERLDLLLEVFAAARFP